MIFAVIKEFDRRSIGEYNRKGSVRINIEFLQNSEQDLVLKINKILMNCINIYIYLIIFKKTRL